MGKSFPGPPSAPRRGRSFPSLFHKLPHWVVRLLEMICITAFWVGIWYLLAWKVGESLLLPTPVAVLKRVYTLAQTAAFWRTVLTSFKRIFWGILIGACAGGLLALMTHFVPVLYKLFYPFITVVRATPVASFVILIFLWVGQDILPIVISVLIVLPVVWADLHEGLGSVDQDLLEMARVFRVPPLRRLRRIYLPSLLPSVVAACRSSVGLAWKAGIAAEVLVVPALSIGRQLYVSKLNLETTDLFAWTLVVVLLSLLLEGFMLFVMRLLDRKRRCRHQRANENPKTEEVVL